MKTNLYVYRHFGAGGCSWNGLQLDEFAKFNAKPFDA